MGKTAKPSKLKKVEPFFLSVADGAAFLGHAEKTVRNQLSEGTFPVRSYKLGGTRVFRLEDLKTYAESIVSEITREDEQ